MTTLNGSWEPVQNGNADSPLCDAVRNAPETVTNLLEQGAEVDRIEATTGQTPLCIACINGNLTIVQTLVDYGADVIKQDSTGWLPIEHAACHGHFRVIAFLEQHGATRQTQLSLPRLAPSPRGQHDQKAGDHVAWLQEKPIPEGGSHLWISLGSNDATRPYRTVSFNKGLEGLSNHANATSASSSLSVSLAGDPNVEYSVALPVHGRSVNRPWHFVSKNLTQAQLIWKFYAHEDGTRDSESRRLIGQGITLLGELNRNMRPHKESLMRETTVPIQATSGYGAGDGMFECIAQVTFSYFSVAHYTPPVPPPPPHCWNFGNGVGGHRGSGKNMINSKKLQVGENTLQSFSTAINHGASFLEFDVQLTSDLVPVIYHDLLVSETGTNSPMHTLTFEQFEQLSKTQGPRTPRLSRSNSFNATDTPHLDDLAERMTRTKFHSVQGFKANTRGTFIRESSCTLVDILKQIPLYVNLNIELKYPMLFEADEWDLELLAIKTDIFVDTVLDKVYEHARDRTIVFSSFSPEICIALSTKQRTWPVFFLSKTAAPRGEVRSSCIQQAVEFAKSWGLPGIVVECTPLIKCPRLIEYVKSAGLAIMSFGVGNSEPENAKIQFDGGINAVISDSVRAIAQLSGLPGSNGSAEPVKVYP
ncbi:Glycerophosphocholine phosphodiesterase [Saxophila tyrrhenica]|uniref:Glycerophosphocholine phosphodiesterase n=1 Tax=Saxophila tyrrhenica TaxID=1690608 RepID=A0AAV9PD06_9PEZI|nr:Glycerophosphocholine phosphodiesterase [Saxophila tyrrhenica]